MVDLTRHTQDAVEEFQAAHDLTPDRLIGSKTWAALQAV
jgi:peptidoglycan hydrolase-like protein with peptidoglycan-binding domain